MRNQEVLYAVHNALLASSELRRWDCSIGRTHPEGTTDRAHEACLVLPELRLTPPPPLTHTNLVPG